MIGDRRYKLSKMAFGLNNYRYEKNILKFSFGYTDYHRVPANANTTVVVNAAASSATAATTVTTGITNPDVPRVLSVTPGGTASSISTSTVTVTGTNVEGKVITDVFNITAGSTATVNGTKAFKTVTSVLIPKQIAGGATFSVGTLNLLGLYHRLPSGLFGIRVILDTTPAVGNELDIHTFDAQPTVTSHTSLLEQNYIQPVTAPNGTIAFRIAYYYTTWSLDDTEGKENYFTSTSTSSTSSSTSTTTITTSTSSTSSSISSTSASSTSTSLSTSSTSTSTTTLP